MVSESRFQKDSVLKMRVDTLGVNECLAGKSGVAIYPDYRNIPVIGSWHPVKYTNLVLLAEIDEEVGEGKLDRDVKIQSYDEIGFLITVFNEMIKKFKI